MNKETIEDIVEWDVKNWSKALEYWMSESNIKMGNNHCLELGGRGGGMSLWLALNGNEVICSDVESPEPYASKLHAKYNCSNRVSYQAIDATNMPYENKFDLVVFKSVLGGISSNGRDELKKKAIDEIYKALKPSGKLLFAENLESSFLHKILRKRFIKWGGSWNYLKYEEIDSTFNTFENVKYKTFGFFGAFGRTERQRGVLGNLDNLINPIIPRAKKYIVYGVAEKGR